MRPTIIDEPCIIASARVAAWLGLFRVPAMVKAEAHRDRLDMPAEVAEYLAKLDQFGEAYRIRRNADETQSVSLVDAERSVVRKVEWITAKEAAALLSVRTSQAVTGRCRRGTLHAKQLSNRSWRVCRESAIASKGKNPCSH